MKKLNRRTLLSWAAVYSQFLLAACGGGGNGDRGTSSASGPRDASAGAADGSASPAVPPTPSPEPSPSSSLQWSPPSSMLFSAHGARTMDLSTTLPSALSKDGRFEVDSSGTPLPIGVTLSPAGMLTVGPEAQPGAILGVVFAYVVA